MENREKDLITQAKAGDEHSFELLIMQCKTRAYNIALRYMRNEEDALDVLQESFIKIFRHLSKFKEDSRFDTWVYRIVVNTCNDMLRKNQNANNTERLYHESDEDSYVAEIPDKGPTPWEAIEHKEKSEFLLACLNAIQPEQREILILRDIQGFSYEEISEMLDCGLGTVKSRINRARNKLKSMILEQNNENLV